LLVIYLAAILNLMNKVTRILSAPEQGEAHAAEQLTESGWTTKETHVKFLRPDLATSRVP
jgi:hypothetical protein